MPICRYIPRFAALLVLALCTHTLHAQTGPGTPAKDQAGGDGIVDPAENPEPQPAAPQPAADTPAETPAADEAPAPNTPVPQVVTPPAGNVQATGQAEGEALPDEMLSARGSVELFLSEADAVYIENEADPLILLKFLPKNVREAFDNAGTREARRLAQSLIEIRERNADFLRLDRIPINVTGALYTWKVNAGTTERPDDRSFSLVKGPNGYWRFTEDAIENARELHAELFADSAEYVLRSL
ncbi:MAG: hypothetical protein AAGH64_06800, partial [Planctomycetota bacterium]